MKRFTETGKWEDPWFGELPPMAKLLWYFLCDNCDHAGVWEVNARLADFKIGAPMPWSECHTWFGDRVRVLPGGKWLLPKFVRFQSPHGLKPHDKITIHIMGRLKHHGLTLADVGLDNSETRAGECPDRPVAAAPAENGQKKSERVSSPEGASKGHGRGIHPLQGKGKDSDRVGNMSLSRSPELDGGSRGEAPPRATPAGTNAERLSRALRRHGLDASAGARSEWGDMLQGRGKCTTMDQVLAALEWIMIRAKRDLVLVRYAKHAAPLADEWVRSDRRKEVL